MLATSNYMSSASHGFLPTIPSPLSPRSANIYGRRRFSFMSSSDEKLDNNTQNIPYSKRPVKKAPSPKQDELKERRRKLFLKKVQDEREEKRFEARGEDIMRLDFVQRQRQWEAEQARNAPQMPSDPPEEEDEDYDLPMSSGNAMQISAPSTQMPQLLYDEVEEVLQRENQELEALLSYMPADEYDGDQHSEHHLWSDDDDYDALFSELMEQENVQAGQPKQNLTPAPSQDYEAMDMS